MSDYMNAKREIAKAKEAAAARIEAAAMVERERQRRQTAPAPELSHTDVDATRIAFIAVREIDDGYKSDVYVLPQDPHAPLIAVACPFDTAQAAEHYNQEGGDAVTLIHSKFSRMAVNINTVSRLDRTPGAITSALAYWPTSDAPKGVPVHLGREEMDAIEAQLALAQLRTMAAQGLVDRHKRTDAHHQLAS